MSSLAVSMRSHFDAFVNDRRYSKGVSRRTEQWYRESWRAFSPALESRSPNELSKSILTPQVQALLARGTSAITVNTYARAINAFLRWMSQEELMEHPLRIPHLKEEQQVVQTFKPEHIQSLVHYRLNNLRSNLRLCTASQNQQNSSGQRRRASRFKGVSRGAGPRMKHKWRASIKVDGKQKHLGHFTSEEAAAAAYNRAAIEIFGEFVRLNEIPDDFTTL